MSKNDVESGKLDYLNAAPPPAKTEPLPAKVAKELKRNWWLWSAVTFVVVLLLGLFIFRNELYSTSGHGLPFLAVKENASEACETQCTQEGIVVSVEGQAPAEEKTDPKKKEEYDACYVKCVSEETKEVAEEREKFKANEEKFAEADDKKNEVVKAEPDTDAATTA